MVTVSVRLSRARRSPRWKKLDQVKVDALFRKPLDVVALVAKSMELLGQNAASTPTK